MGRDDGTLLKNMDQFWYQAKNKNKYAEENANNVELGSTRSKGQRNNDQQEQRSDRNKDAQIQQDFRTLNANTRPEDRISQFSGAGYGNGELMDRGRT